MVPLPELPWFCITLRSPTFTEKMPKHVAVLHQRLARRANLTTCARFTSRPYKGVKRESIARAVLARRPGGFTRQRMSIKALDTYALESKLWFDSPS